MAGRDGTAPRIAVIGASAGLGRCIGVGLARRGADVALLARRRERLDNAVAEAGPRACAVVCDVTDETSCGAAVAEAAARLGGLDSLVYTPGIGPLGPIEDTDAATWRSVLDTNVVGAALVTAAALAHLVASKGTAVYLSSVSGSHTPPWPGLGAYAVSKAALDKMVDAWRAEHPEVGFTRLVVGECAGADGEGATEFAAGWSPELAAHYMDRWLQRGYMSGALVDVDQLVATIDLIARSHASVSMSTVTVAPRLVEP